MLQPDTQVILLLCASFGQNRQTEPQPLTLSEYNSVAGWLRENHLTPKNLLDPTCSQKLKETTIGKLDSERIIALLNRSFMLSLAVEKWTNQGLWILARSDRHYPKCLKQKLKHSAPAILYGVGKIELLSQGGLAIVGSRDVDAEGLSYTTNVVQTCVAEGIQVVSGGARGVDQAAMLAALEAGGTAVGVLADSLSKAAVSSKFRSSIQEDKLTLISPYDPDAGFSVGNAMGRNKYIYALADYSLVISSLIEKGGTWAGATEALKKIKNTPVFVRMQGDVPAGNYQLIKNQAKPFPDFPWNQPLKELLQIAVAEIEAEENISQSVRKATVESTQVASNITSNPNFQITPQKSRPQNIYEAVLPFILEKLEQPLDDKTLADSLDVQVGQMRIWLKQAVAEGKVIKHNKPVTYELNRHQDLLPS
ncbi:MAG: DNA-processing protein DprA [Oscillatoria sp. PMC 1051.18]|nr:DNA-processing protein DprA [Oscillatoria sp. PMC 1050.18]MEC5030376.1 DNA-processing protein DprA [Oscillatoria sp. PMC 1051.18]